MRRRPPAVVPSATHRGSTWAGSTMRPENTKSPANSSSISTIVTRCFVSFADVVLVPLQRWARRQPRERGRIGYPPQEGHSEPGCAEPAAHARSGTPVGSRFRTRASRCGCGHAGAPGEIGAPVVVATTYSNRGKGRRDRLLLRVKANHHALGGTFYVFVPPVGGARSSSRPPARMGRQVPKAR